VQRYMLVPKGRERRRNWSHRVICGSGG